MPDKIIYLDNASTTFPSKEILNSFNEFVIKYPGNPGSIHKLGQNSTRVLDKSRALILKSLNLNDEYDVVFTSGATEANNLALKGVCEKYSNRGKHIIVSEIEHPSILEVARALERKGFKVTYLSINSDGIVDPETLRNVMTDETILVSIMGANNEIGSVNKISELSKIVRSFPKAFFHVDAVQALGKISLNYSDADLITITGHKIHGLCGCGCLIKKSKINLEPIVHGGGQQLGIRSGTECLALSASFALAVKAARENEKNAFKALFPLAEKLVNYLSQNESLYELNSNYKTNPCVVNFSLKNKKASVVVEALSQENILVSSISACHSHGEPYSYVVEALKHDENLSHNTIRVSFSLENTIDDVSIFIECLDRIVKSIK